MLMLALEFVWQVVKSLQLWSITKSTPRLEEQLHGYYYSIRGNFYNAYVFSEKDQVYTISELSEASGERLLFSGWSSSTASSSKSSS